MFQSLVIVVVLVFIGIFVEGQHCDINCIRTGCTNNSCSECVDGYFASSGECRPCQENCKKCSSLNFCDECQDDFNQIHAISRNVTICLTCPGSCTDCRGHDWCYKCKTGYYGPRCDRDCNRCINSLCGMSNCRIGCKEGYFPYDKGGDAQCVPCSTYGVGCLACFWSNHIATCTKCKPGYYKKSRRCSPKVTTDTSTSTTSAARHITTQTKTSTITSATSAARHFTTQTQTSTSTSAMSAARNITTQTQYTNISASTTSAAKNITTQTQYTNPPTKDSPLVAVLAGALTAGVVVVIVIVMFVVVIVVLVKRRHDIRSHTNTTIDSKTPEGDTEADSSNAGTEYTTIGEVADGTGSGYETLDKQQPVEAEYAALA